jgi:hypothetical protein
MDINFSGLEEIQRLKQARLQVLRLHKALIDAERDAYERQHGRVASNLEFFNLVMNHEWFVWLQPMTQWIVAVDEAVAQKDPVITVDQAQMFLLDAVVLLETEGDRDHVDRYCMVIDRVPAVARLHEELCLILE